MPSAHHNSITAKAMGWLVLSLFNVVLVQEMPFANVFFMDSFVSHLSLLTAKSVNLVVVHGFLWSIHTGYFNSRVTFP